MRRAIRREIISHGYRRHSARGVGDRGAGSSSPVSSESSGSIQEVKADVLSSQPDSRLGELPIQTLETVESFLRALETPLPLETKERFVRALRVCSGWNTDVSGVRERYERTSIDLDPRRVTVEYYED